jgi:hypothetical protein
VSRDPFGKLEFTSESSGGITPLKCSKGDGDQNCLIEVKFRRENAESFGQKSLRSESGGQNSPWRTRKVMRTCKTQRRCKVVRSWMNPPPCIS